MARKKLLFILFISKNSKFSIFYNYSDDSESYSISFDNVYIFNDKLVNHNKFLLGTINIPEDKLEEVFFVVSIKFKEIFIFDKENLANSLEELGFDIFDKDYKNEYDEEAKDDILRKNIKKALKIIENTLNDFSKEDNLIIPLKKELHSKSIPFSKLAQPNLYNKIKRFWNGNYF